MYYNGIKWNQMMNVAEYLELTLIMQKAIECHGRVNVLDFTPSAIYYRVTFWYYKNWNDIRKNSVYKLVKDMQINRRITELDHGYQRDRLSILEQIREFFRRDEFVIEYVTFKVETQNYDIVLSGLKKTLGILVAQNP